MRTWLVLTPLALTLVACCGSFTLDEQETKTFAELGLPPADDLEVDFSCRLKGGVTDPLERACLLLGDEARYVVELNKRKARALTKEEEQRLGGLCEQISQDLVRNVKGLQTAIAQLEQPQANQRLCVVLDLDDYAVIENPGASASPIDSTTPAIDRSTINAHFGELRVLSRDERPLGVVLRQLSEREALSMLVDSMREHAEKQGYLTPETKSALE